MNLKTLSLLLFPVIVILSSIFGCSDEPSSIGIGFFPDTLQIQTMESTATGDTTFLYRIRGYSPRGSLINLLTGMDAHIEARTLLEFSLSSISIPRIDSAILVLPIGYRFRDTSGEFGASVREMTRTWSEASFTWDSISGSFGSTDIGSVNRIVLAQDTALRISLDTTTIRQWLTAGSGDLILVPSPGLQYVLGFTYQITTSGDIRPELAISYHDTTDSAITVQRKSTRALFVANGPAPVQPERFFAGSAIGYRGLIRFDSLAIPELSVIQQALLDIAVDTTSSITNRQSRDSLIIGLLRKNQYPYDSLAFSVIAKPVMRSQQKVYEADITRIVQQWYTREPNLGLAVLSYGELLNVDRFALYGAGSPEALRPRIRITYTQLP